MEDPEEIRVFKLAMIKERCKLLRNKSIDLIGILLSSCCINSRIEKFEKLARGEDILFRAPTLTN